MFFIGVLQNNFPCNLGLKNVKPILLDNLVREAVYHRVKPLEQYFRGRLSGVLELLASTLLAYLFAKINNIVKKQFFNANVSCYFKALV